MYFYDLENGRTCAKVSKAELLIDCYEHPTDARLSNIRYMQDHQIIVRSVDFSQSVTNMDNHHQHIYEIDRDNTNLIAHTKILI